MKKLASNLFLFALILSKIIFSQSFTNIQITQDSSADVWADMAIDGEGNIHIVWIKALVDNSGNGLADIYYMNNLGGDFVDTKIAGGFTEVGMPSIAVNNSGVAYIVWNDSLGEIFYTNNEAGTFSTATQITSDTQFDSSPKITVDNNGKIYIIWLLNESGDVQYTNNIDGTFSDPITILETVNDIQFTIDKNNNIHIVGIKRDSESNVVYVNNVNGTFESTILPLPTGFENGYSYNPSVGLDSDQRAHIIWKMEKYNDPSSNNYVYYSNNIDGPFSTPTAIVDSSADILYSSLTIDDNNNIHIIYAAENDIYYSNDINDSLLIFTNITNDQGVPDIILRSNQHHILFNEIDKNINILYSRQFEDFNSMELMLASASIMTDIDLDQTAVVKHYELSQNFPNPFNPSTKIYYTVYESNFVTLKVFDVLGKEIKTLVNKFHSPGVYYINFEASRFSTGVYFYRIQIGDSFSETRKMLYLQ